VNQHTDSRVNIPSISLNAPLPRQNQLPVLSTNIHLPPISYVERGIIDRSNFSQNSNPSQSPAQLKRHTIVSITPIIEPKRATEPEIIRCSYNNCESAIAKECIYCDRPYCRDHLPNCSYPDAYDVLEFKCPLCGGRN